MAAIAIPRRGTPARPPSAGSRSRRASRRTTDYFLHVLTATDAEVADVESATATVGDQQVQVKLGAATITFATDKVGGTIELAGQKTSLPETVVLPYAQ